MNDNGYNRECWCAKANRYVIAGLTRNLYYTLLQVRLRIKPAMTIYR